MATTAASATKRTNGKSSNPDVMAVIFPTFVFQVIAPATSGMNSTANKAAAIKKRMDMPAVYQNVGCGERERQGSYFGANSGRAYDSR